MSRLFWICIGGAVGTGARYLLCEWALATFGAQFPFGTLLVNVLGSFLLALLTVLGLETTALSPTLRLVLTTGVMGGFTTYSTFSYETLRCFQIGAWWAGIGNVLATVLGCLAACLLGWWLGQRIAGA